MTPWSMKEEGNLCCASGTFLLISSREKLNQPNGVQTGKHCSNLS
uniref:Uncharacterized protein n=1 Tax=Lepeophtheirus salmonis TaxID=72036 RepID=A0A0K2TUB9_LEPSM